MTLHYELNNPEIIAFVKAQAREVKKPPQEIIEIILERLIAVQNAFTEDELPSSRFKRIRESMLDRRGGKKFSDSTDIIRASREHDH